MSDQKTIVVEVLSTDVTTKSGVSARNQKPYSIREQVGYVQFPGKPYPQEIKFALEEGAGAYPQGRYEVHPDSFYVDNFGGLKIGRLKLKSIPANLQKVG